MEPIDHPSAEDGQFVTVLSVALDGPQVHEQGTVQAEQVEGVPGHKAALAISRGMAGMLQLMTIDGIDGPIPQVRKGAEKILARVAPPDVSACDQEGIEFTQQSLTPGRMQRVEEGRAPERLAKRLGALLEEIPPADRLTEDPQDAQAHKIRIGDDTLGANIPDIAVQKSVGGCEQLVEQQRIGGDIGAGWVTVEGRRSHAIRVSKAA